GRPDGADHVCPQPLSMPMRPKRLHRTLCAAAIGLALAGPACAGPTSGDPHRLALAALRGLRATIATIVAAENATSSGPAEYKRDAQRAINALVGREDSQYVPDVGNPGDASGVMGNLNQLVDRVGTPPWVPAVHGAQANVMAALGSLNDAMHARSLSRFEVAASQAILNLEVAIGRRSEPDVLGGLSGALANTELAVPQHATRLDGCTLPERSGYGLSNGYLVYRAVAIPSGSATIENPGGSIIQRHGTMLILYTPAAAAVQARCSAHSSAQSRLQPAPQSVPQARLQPVTWTVQAGPRAATLEFTPGVTPAHAEPAGATETDAMPPYTAAQAGEGRGIYEKSCASCHGSGLQGVAAPAIAGSDFRSTAQRNGWTLGILRTIVTENMPFNDPGSLNPKQYADVMAYLLASNCYPAGAKPFPLHGSAKLSAMHLKDPPVSAEANARGVCQQK
ncbi:MAG: cytochrome c, partial [Betaproteobacteria bacterium]|nr:cytochrome c [Betaproteobacteria bacterium]